MRAVSIGTMAPTAPRGLGSVVSCLPGGDRLVPFVGELRLAVGVLRGREAWPGIQQPFNGQILRLRTVRAVIDAFEPDAFVETGTFVGSTTRFFSGNGVPVYTTEVKRHFWLLARIRLGWSRDITVMRGDSRIALKRLAQHESFARPLIYLDAHWWDDFPLNEELDLVFRSWADAVVVVDDFRVDGDDGYAFDTYDGVALAISDIKVPDGVMLAAPAQPSSQETGARRGALYLAKGPRAEQAVKALADRDLLRLL